MVAHRAREQPAPLPVWGRALLGGNGCLALVGSADWSRLDRPLEALGDDGLGGQGDIKASVT